MAAKKKKGQLNFVPTSPIVQGMTYVHKHYERFELNNSFIGDVDTGEIAKNYQDAHSLAKSRMANLYTRAGVDENSAKASVAALEGLINLSKNSSGVENYFENSIKQGTTELIDKIKSEINPMGLKSGTSYKMVASSSMNWLNSTLNAINTIGDDIGKLDETLINYLSDEEQATLKIGDNISMVHIDKAATTSLKNLNTRIDAISKLADKGPKGEILFKAPPVKGIDLGGNKGEKTVANVMQGMGQQVLNIQGSLLEGATYSLMAKGANSILKGLGAEGELLEVVSLGGSDNKSDVALRIVDKNDSTNIILNIGISSKATIVKSGSETVFQTSSWETIMHDANLLNSIVEYKLANYSVHDKTRMGEAIQLRKYIASKNAAMAIMGKNKNDEIYFIQTLNSVTSVDSFFETLIAQKNFLTLAPEKSAAVTFGPARMENKDFEATAYIRSKQVMDKLRRGTLQYTFKHL